MKPAFLILIIIVFTCFSCTKSSDTSGNLAGTVYMWIAPVADTKLDADNPDLNFWKAGDNTYARYHIPGSVIWHVTTYVKFQVPILPPGTKIDEAYFEMFHSGTTEDGTTDDAIFFVSNIDAVWRADSVTWNKSPDNGAITNGASPVTCKLHSNDWSGSTDISAIIKTWFADTTVTTGWGLRVTSTAPTTFFKSFYSNNSFIGAGNKDGRTDSTVGKSPRLLVKIELPTGYTTKDIRWKTIPLDFDFALGAFTAKNGYIWMANYRSGSDWPSDWGVKKGL